jgi:hypothetical protein
MRLDKPDYLFCLFHNGNGFVCYRDTGALVGGQAEQRGGFLYSYNVVDDNSSARR